MTDYEKDACLMMARTFTYEYIHKNDLDKKQFAIVHEFNKRLGELAAKMFKKRGGTGVASKQSAYVLERLEPIAISVAKDYDIEVDSDTGDIKMEGNLLLMATNFVFLLIEENFFKGSAAMYFKRISMEIYSEAEKVLDYKTVKATNVLATLLYEEFENEKIN